MKIAIGSDEWSQVVQDTINYIQQNGHQVTYFGATEEKSTPWSRAASHVAAKVASQEYEEGVLFCWTGTGVSIAANKVSGVRAALCADAETARGARLWNKANVLCLSLRTTTSAIAREILDSWFSTHYIPNPEDDACIAEIEILDTKRE